MTKIKYLLKQKLNQLSKSDYDLAMKAICKELDISEATFYRDLGGHSGDIPHYRFLQYCKFLSIDDKELEGFDREEINIRPLESLKEKKDKAQQAGDVRNDIGLNK
jgi:hypothetical protein